MPKIKRILVAVDFSKPSLAALRYGADLARMLKARLEIVHVVEPLTYAPMIGSAVDLDKFREEQERAAQRGLAELATDLRRKGVRCRTELKVGAAPSAILDLAKRSAAHLIVMATEGRHGIGRLLLGSVAERVVRNAPCPVLTVRARANR
ncbi:MAG TPA: universal stress protein [Candidatus Binatia bacterium]|nr:universal stress protein [Candidatus Binatia bacterium]